MSLSIYNARLLDPASNLDEVGAIYVDRGKFKEISAGQTTPHEDAKASMLRLMCAACQNRRARH